MYQEVLQSCASVAILTFYEAQRRNLESILPYVRILNVDSAQGSRFDGVILCTTRLQATPFMLEYSRTLVSLTRLKKFLAVSAGYESGR